MTIERTTKNPMASRDRDDRVYREARWLAAFIIPFLFFAVATLYVIPDQTDRYWSWTIKATMTSMTLAAAYFAGIFFFGRVLVSRHWHHVKAGFLPIATFAAMLGIATILHWDKFRHGQLPFFLWAGLYFTAPFLVLVVWLRNRATDPGVADPDDVAIPTLARGLVSAVGVTLCAVALTLYVVPDVGIATWPWSLTQLTARVVGAIFALPALALVGIAFDGRWSSARIVFQALAISFLLILIAAARAWNEFNPNAPITYVFIVATGLVFVAIVVAYLQMEARRSAIASRGQLLPM